MAAPSVILYFGETSGFWIQTGAVILSAIAAITTPFRVSWFIVYCTTGIMTIHS